MASTPKPQKPTTMQVPVERLIRAVDPDFDRARRRETEYDFGPKGRVFVADPKKRGAYGG